MDGGERFDADRVRHTVRSEPPSDPAVTIGAPDLMRSSAHISRGPSKIRDRDKISKFSRRGSNSAVSGGARCENCCDSRLIPKRIRRRFVG